MGILSKFKPLSPLSKIDDNGLIHKKRNKAARKRLRKQRALQKEIEGHKRKGFYTKDGKAICQICGEALDKIATRGHLRRPDHNITTKEYKDKFEAPTESISLRMKRRKIAIDGKFRDFIPHDIKITSKECKNEIKIKRTYSLYEGNKVVCQICGKSFDHIEYHLMHAHSVSPAYYRRCLGNDVPMFSKDSRKKHSKACKLGAKEIEGLTEQRVAQAHTPKALSNLSKSLRVFYNTPEGRRKQYEKTREQYWDNPEKKARARDKMKEFYSTPEGKQVCRDRMSDKIKHGGSKLYLRGWYTSEKTGRECWHDSSLELGAFIKLDGDDSVVDFEAQPFQIVYELDGEDKEYTPDLLVTIRGGQKIVVEVKPRRKTNTPKNQAKFAFAKAFCKSKGWEFQVWSDKDIFDNTKDKYSLIKSFRAKQASS